MRLVVRSREQTARAVKQWGQVIAVWALQTWRADIAAEVRWREQAARAGERAVSVYSLLRGSLDEPRWIFRTPHPLPWLEL